MDQWRTAANAMQAARELLEAPVKAGLVGGNDKTFLEDLMDETDQRLVFLEVVAAIGRAAEGLRAEAALMSNSEAAKPLLQLADDLAKAAADYMKVRGAP